MHLVNLSKPITHADYWSGTLEPGLYYTFNPLAGLLLLDGYSKQIQPSDVPFGPMEENESPSRIIIVHPVGFGDLLFLTPSLVKLGLLFPEAEICVSVLAPYVQALRGVPEIQILPYPLPRTETLNRGTRIISLENAIVGERELHAVDAIARRIGITLYEEDGKHCRYSISREDTTKASFRYPRNGKPRLGIQVLASTHNRTYPFQPLITVIADLVEDGWEILLFGAPGQVPLPENAAVTNLTSAANPPDFYESACILTTCDVVLAPDSALAHLAGALGIQTVALYGPYPWKLRTAYHPSVRAVTGVARCSPCFAGADWPEHGPCAQSHKCEALMDIPPGRVINEIEKAYERSQEGVTK